MGLDTAKKQRVKDQASFVQSLYDRESDEVKQIVQEERNKLYEEAVKEWERTQKHADTPDAIQRYWCSFFLCGTFGLTLNNDSAIDHMVPEIKAFTKSLNDRTKLCVTVIVGGPSPGQGGQIITTQYVNRCVF